MTDEFPIGETYIANIRPGTVTISPNTPLPEHLYQYLNGRDLIGVMFEDRRVGSMSPLRRCPRTDPWRCSFALAQMSARMVVASRRRVCRRQREGSIGRPGTPTTVVAGATFFVTTAPAPTTDQSPGLILR